MNFRARLSLFALESRETPSGPAPLDPTGDTSTPQDPTDPALSSSTDTSSGDTSTNTSDPLLGTNDIFNTPLVP